VRRANDRGDVPEGRRGAQDPLADERVLADERPLALVRAEPERMPDVDGERADGIEMHHAGEDHEAGVHPAVEEALEWALRSSSQDSDGIRRKADDRGDACQVDPPLVAHAV